MYIFSVTLFIVHCIILTFNNVITTNQWTDTFNLELYRTLCLKVYIKDRKSFNILYEGNRLLRTNLLDLVHFLTHYIYVLYSSLLHTSDTSFVYRLNYFIVFINTPTLLYSLLLTLLLLIKSIYESPETFVKSKNIISSTFRYRPVKMPSRLYHPSIYALLLQSDSIFTGYSLLLPNWIPHHHFTIPS